MRILTADYVVPISSDAIENGAVVIENDLIITVGPIAEVAEKFPETIIENFGQAAILPGFVNCHSHLELTSMRGLLDDVEHDFRAWLLKLNGERADLTDEEIAASAVAGAVEGAEAGVTCFGDIGRFGKAGFEALRTVGLRGVLFQETEFSPDDRTADDDFYALKEKFLKFRETETSLVKVGLSPHSPYTVSPMLLEKITDFALAENIPITIHAAESSDEKILLENGSGFFTDFYKRLGFEWKTPHCSSIEFLDRIGVLRARPLLAHCVTVSDEDIAKISASGSSVAHCPKSNAKFGHGFAPLETFLDKRITVGLGSDSMASNNVCDLLEESRFAVLAARNRHGSNRFITAKEALAAATLGGAKALGLDDKIGTLEPGKQADIAIVSLANAAQQPINDIYSALVFASNARDLLMTVVAGREIFGGTSDEGSERRGGMK